MLTSLDFYHKYGNPESKEFQKKYLVVWDVPSVLEIGFIPKKIYCNKDIIEPSMKAFQFLIATGNVNEIKTFDGCCNVRPMRGSEERYKALMKAGKIEEAMKYLSVHSWAAAYDFNAFSNPLGLTVDQIKAKGLEPFTEGFLQCFRDAGFDCGGDWKKRPDRMHFQLSRI